MASDVHVCTHKGISRQRLQRVGVHFTTPDWSRHEDEYRLIQSILVASSEQMIVVSKLFWVFDSITSGQPHVIWQDWE